MAQSYFLQLNNNDDLSKVIKKCNTNFMALATQKQQQDIVNQQTEENISEQIGQALSGVVGMIDTEAENRRQADLDLDNAIDLCAKSANLATVATSGDYNDLINIPTIPINGAYLTFGNESPSTIHGGTWTMAGTLTVGSEVLYAWKRTA